MKIGEKKDHYDDRRDNLRQAEQQTSIRDHGDRRIWRAFDKPYTEDPEDCGNAQINIICQLLYK